MSLEAELILTSQRADLISGTVTGAWPRSSRQKKAPGLPMWDWGKF